MKTKAVRMAGKNQLLFGEVELPKIREDEILARVVSDSLCMSTYKAVQQGSEHSKVPNNVAQMPVMLGHEFCGEILEVGAKWIDFCFTNKDNASCFSLRHPSNEKIILK